MSINVLDLSTTSNTTFQIGILGPQIKNNAGNLELTNAAGSADVSLTALKLNLSGTSGQIVLNSAATESGSSWKTTLQNAVSGQTADLILSLPPTAGTSGQVLQTDGSGNTSWVSVSSGAAYDTNVIHTVNYSDTSPYAYLTLPANAIIKEISVMVDTAFNGTGPSLSVGVSGTPSKFMVAGASDLTTAGQYSTTAVQEVATSGTSQAIILTFNAGVGATAGVARVMMTYTVPTSV